VLSRPFARDVRRLVIAVAIAALAVSPAASLPGLATGHAAAATPVPYAATIADARAAAKSALADTGAASMSVALVDGDRIVWREAFGVADRATGAKPTDATMYGIGSVSKMFVAVAVMQLVDDGRIRLDAPVVQYVPAFRMADPAYAQITVRMLLDHSAGLPGSDYYNTLTTAPNPDYMARQFLAGLATARLKTTPGSMSVYCNDCFTLAELVVAAVAGEPYDTYVTDEIIGPLAMTHTRFPTEAFAADTFAHAYRDLTTTTAEPQEFVNLYGSGAVWSTPTDMSHLAMMLMNGGVYAGRRILSAASVAEMGRDQVRNTLDPAPINPYIFGLGWDTVRQLGLATVGQVGWVKGGDTAAYHAALEVAPGAKLSVIVEASGCAIGSTRLEDLAERMLLRALVDTGTLKKMPAVIGATKLPVRTPTAAQIAGIVGVYGAGSATFRVTADASGGLTLATLAGGTRWPRSVSER
jgi:CubicO group peptidase (beta-lactamase class C family)